MIAAAIARLWSVRFLQTRQRSMILAVSTDWDARFDEPSSGCKVYESAGLTLFGLKTLLDSFREHVYCVKLYTFCFLAAEKFSKWQWLTRLNFQSFSLGDLDQLQGALCMLRNSPNLKVLRVTHMPMGPEADLESTCNYLESPDCMDQTLFMLQTVEIISLDGARPELLFIKLLLDHSPHLKNMNIRPRATSDAQKIINIAKDVMLFPRAELHQKQKWSTWIQSHKIV
ncbi:hypothetical protein Hanom_Chr01g00061751 [Helianthus anomalus]